MDNSFGANFREEVKNKMAFFLPLLVLVIAPKNANKKAYAAGAAYAQIGIVCRRKGS